MKRHAWPTRTTEEPRPQGVGMEDEHAMMGNAWFADQLRAGQPLDGGLRGKAEQSLGATLDGIRIHQGPEADAMVAERGAEAFAFGDDIVLGSTVANSANPILAHEVAHVASQRGGGSGGGTGASHEADADNGAMAILAGAPHEMAATNGEVEQCYASDEHAWLGDTAEGSETFVINGVTLTSGDINALADFFGGVDELMNPANAGMLAACAALLEREKAKPGSVQEEEWIAATNGRYEELSLDNSRHFGGRDPAVVPESATPEGATNVGTWESGFRTALTLAIGGGSDPSGGMLEQARITNSFAEHFLTDAFSAGHLFHKGDAMALGQERLGALEGEERDALLAAVAHSVFAAKAAVIGEYEFGTPEWSRADAGSFSWFVWLAYKQKPELVHNALVLNAHNTLNAGYVSVENDRHQWSMSGDETLNSSPETLAAWKGPGPATPLTLVGSISAEKVKEVPGVKSVPGPNWMLRTSYPSWLPMPS